MRVVTFILCTAILQGCWFAKKSKSNDDSATDGNPGLNPSPLGLTRSLQMVESCDAMTSWLREQKLAQLKKYYEQEIYWYFNKGRNDGIVVAGNANAPAATNAPTVDTMSGPGAGADKAASNSAENSSGTNGQAGGVEEADVFKNDSEHLYIARKKELRVIKSWPVESLAQVGKVALKEQPFEMLLRDKQIILFSHIAGEPIENTNNNGQAKPAIGAGDSASSPAYPGNRSYRYTHVTVVDVSNPAAPKITLEKEFKGYYQTSRRSGSAVRFVYHPGVKHPKDTVESLDLWNRTPKNEEAAQAILNEALTKSSDALTAKTAKDWFTTGEAMTVNNCKDVYIPSTGAELAAINLVTLNLDSLGVQEVSVLAQAHELYANQSSFYLASHYYWGGQGPFNYTFIHKFKAADESSLVYAASGGVEGHLINQFAMDEYKDILRIALTTQNDAKKNVNRVQTLQQDGAKLHVLGSTPDLAENERIYSARFMEDRGYIVTFRQIDPLFTLDLSDAANPLVRGELKIPGVSTYLHPVGEHQLVGVGNEAGRLKLSYFDASDIAAPREVNALLYPASSEAQYEHHAVVDASWLNRFAIPTSSYSSQNAALLLFKSSKENGVQEAGKLDVSDLVKGPGFGLSTEPMPGPTSSPMAYRVRGYFMDNVVFALTDVGVRAGKVEDAKVTELKTLKWD